MQAEIRIGVELALMTEHADLVVADENDAALSVFELVNLGDKFFRHWRFQFRKLFSTNAEHPSSWQTRARRIAPSS